MTAGKDLGPRPELVDGGLVRSLGGWSQVLSLRQRGEPEAPDERILGSGDFVQVVLEETDRKPARQVRARMKAGSLLNQEAADYLLTGDRDPLVIGQCLRIRIVTPRSFEGIFAD